MKRRRQDSIEAQQMKQQAKEEQLLREAERKRVQGEQKKLESAERERMELEEKVKRMEGEAQQQREGR